MKSNVLSYQDLIEFVENNDFAYVYGAGIMYANDQDVRDRIAERIAADDEMVITRDGEYYETKTTVIGVIGEIKESDPITKDDVLEMLSGPHMSGCYTAVRSTDAQGYNENYGATPVDSFFDEDSSDYLPDDNWTLTG